MLPAVNCRIDLPLRPMQWIGRTCPRTVGGFDLFDDQTIALRENAIDAALQLEDELCPFALPGNHHLRFITGWTTLLQSLMPFCSFQCPAASHKMPPAPQIPA